MTLFDSFLLGVFANSLPHLLCFYWSVVFSSTASCLFFCCTNYICRYSSWRSGERCVEVLKGFRCSFKSVDARIIAPESVCRCRWVAFGRDDRGCAVFVEPWRWRSRWIGPVGEKQQLFQWERLVFTSCFRRLAVGHTGIPDVDADAIFEYDWNILKCGRIQRPTAQGTF